jgi:hypothetical protein
VGSIWELIRGGPLTVADANALYVQKTGDTMAGQLVLVGNPTLPLHAADKNYVDIQLAQYLPLSGGVLTGSLSMPAAYIPVNPEEVATKHYVDTAAGGGGPATVFVDGISILGNGAAATPLTVGTIDGGIF